MSQTILHSTLSTCHLQFTGDKAVYGWNIMANFCIHERVWLFTAIRWQMVLAYQTSFLNALLSSRLKPGAAFSNSSQLPRHLTECSVRLSAWLMPKAFQDAASVPHHTALMQCVHSKAWQKMHIMQGIAGTVMDQHNSSAKWGHMMAWWLEWLNMQLLEHVSCMQCLPMLVRCALLANRLWAKTFRKSVDTDI